MCMYNCSWENLKKHYSGIFQIMVLHMCFSDKLAALWPFLGIVAEVAILCLIIFIYEKKRSKESDDEEDAPLQKT